MTIEPILNWETVTLSKIKRQINKLRKQLNQTETEVKRRKIYGEFTRLNKSSEIGSSQPSILPEVDENMPLITQIMREWLDKLGLPQTDLVILKNVIGASNLAEGRAAGGFVGPEFIRQRFVVKGKEYIIPVFPDLTYGLIQIAFNMDHYQLVNERIKRNKMIFC